jgi:hypothetical protein
MVSVLTCWQQHAHVFQRVYRLDNCAELEDRDFTAKELQELARSGAIADFALDGVQFGADGTFQLTKGRLEIEEDGSTVVVRGGHEYDADTDTVSVTGGERKRAVAKPDGLLVDDSGEVRL